MSKLEEKLNQAETLTRKILDSEIDYGSESFILKLISALRKALEQRNEWVAEKYKDPSIKNREQQDAEILQILEGE